MHRTRICICPHNTSLSGMLFMIKYHTSDRGTGNDLLDMQSQHFPIPVAQELAGINSPILPFIADWDAYLRSDPDEYFKEYILRGIREGFRIGFYRSNQLFPGKHNILSVSQKPQLVEEYSHPLNYPMAKRQSVIIPKGHNTGK